MINKRLKIRYISWDCFAALATWFSFNIYRYNILPLEEIYGSFFNFISSPRSLLAQFIYPLGMMLIFHLSGYYNRVVFKSRAGEFFSTNLNLYLGGIYIVPFIDEQVYLYRIQL